jgi:uncharacterized protein DUF4157
MRKKYKRSKTNLPGQLVQRQSRETAPFFSPSPNLHQSPIPGSGKALPESSRSFFEPRFGQDFSHVRIHHDHEAAGSAESINALAFTTGNNIVFNEGQYSPESEQGKKLLAHELTHVMQQSQTDSSPRIMKQEKADSPSKKGENPTKKTDPPAQKRDVVIVTAENLGTEANVISKDPLIIHVTSLDDMNRKLKAINFPIGRLIVSSHALPDGSLLFESGDVIKDEDADLIAKKLKGSIKPEFAPDLVDFRGCTIGQSPAAMDAIRNSVGAKGATAGNCYIANWPMGPVNLNGKPITKPSQVKAGDRSAFEKGLQMLRDSFGPAKKCIIDDSEEAYFRAGGKMVAQYFNSDLNATWEERKSVCYSSLTPEQVDPSKGASTDPGLEGNCKLIHVGK